MENLIISVNAILPMFLVMALGYGARCLGWIRREEILNINRIAFRIFLPCLLFYNVYCSDLSGSFDPLLIAYAVGGVLLSFALALGYTLLTEKLPERRGVMIQGMFRSNYVIMGIPVATALLGADQLGTVSILIAIIVPIFNMMSIIVLEVFRGQKPKPLHILGQIAKNPLVIASVLGVLALVAKIRLPYVLEKTVQSVSGIASPLQLFLLGAFFQFSGLRRYARELTAVVAAKLIVFPGLFLGLGALLGESGAGKSTLLKVLAAMCGAEGEYTINGRPCHAYRYADFRRQVTLLAQKTFVFSASIRDNLTMFSGTAQQDEALVKTLAAAGLSEWYADRGASMDAAIGGEAHALSGGEERRLDLARTLWRQGSLVMLDEPTAGLDEKTRVELEKQIAQLPCDILIVAMHNYSPEFLDSFTKVLRIRDGELEP